MRLPTHGGLYAEFEKDGRELKVRIEGQLIVNTTAQILNAALAGLGLAYVPEGMRSPAWPEVVSRACLKTGAFPIPAIISGIQADANPRRPLPCWPMPCDTEDRGCGDGAAVPKLGSSVESRPLCPPESAPARPGPQHARDCGRRAVADVGSLLREREEIAGRLRELARMCSRSGYSVAPPSMAISAPVM